MMLHEAVMLEIYRQALNASELASPRCQSRESSGSGGRCPSDDSNYSGNGNSGPTPTSPIGLPLSATLPPSAAAALLPPQSAAMAAYLNVAAAAAQQNRLLLAGNPLAASLVQVAGHSPSSMHVTSPIPEDSSVLDFSIKRERRDSDTDSKSDSDAVNLSGKSDNGPSDGNCPLDLSVGGRKRSPEDNVPLLPSRKMPRPNEFKQVPATWPPINPYLAAVAAASLSPKNQHPGDWNGKNKMSSNDATKNALEKMSEMTRLGGSSESDMGSSRQANNQSSGGGSVGSSGGGSGRHSAWQSHWLNKGADAAKDVFKCVWCKQSFPTLASLTTHMKETQHCGVNVPPTSNMSNTGGGNQQSHHQHHHHHQSPSSTSSNSSSNKSDLNLLIKETMPLPRKLVRGQDVWLGKGAEQTRQILKCMWCGQSFRSLAEMTSHMQQTQHYTNIISQEQIISWKSSEDKGGSGGGGGAGTGGGPGVQGSGNSGPPANAGAGANSTVSAVLTCKVCDQAFSSLKDLSNHMVKNAHYKEHIMRSITESGGRRRQTREKRKKSLPVRKLLELERAQHDFKNGDVKPIRGGNAADLAGSTRITCEKCGDKIETALFVEHIRQCVGGSIPNSPRSSLMKTPLSANSIIPPDAMNSPLTPNSRDGRKSIGRGDESTSPASSNRHISPHTSDLASPSPKDNNISGGEKSSSSPSVLNAIEQLIEKSFDTRSRHSNAGYTVNNHNNAPLGSSILKRLGIDESVDYTKPLMDQQTMNLLRSYQQSQYPRRERSGSESSSVSDRGSSRLESLTPERKLDVLNHSSLRHSPDKGAYSEQEDDVKDFKVKNEPNDDDDLDCSHSDVDKINIKTEPNCEDNGKETDGGELDLSSRRKSTTPASSVASPNHTSQPSTSAMASPPAASPCSDRSITPRSSTSIASEKKMPSGSLNALSSMFDNLNAANTTSGMSSSETGGHSTGKKGSSHPLAALQKLCDKTENTPNSRSGSTGALAANIPPTTGGSNSGNMIAFSWACNDAVMTSDSIIKCAFCDTPFCSKGAYRHHLSKVHFVKDDINMDSLAMKSAINAVNSSSSGSNSTSGNGNNSKQQQQQHQRPSSSQSPKGSSTGNGSTPTPTTSRDGGEKSPQPSSNSQSPFDESPHSKFLKYTELAKQLSSKYV